MKFAELKEKTEKELESLLAQARSVLRVHRSKVAFKQLKGVREIRKERQMIARLLTLLRAQKK